MSTSTELPGTVTANGAGASDPTPEHPVSEATETDLRSYVLREGIRNTNLPAGLSAAPPPADDPASSLEQEIRRGHRAVRSAGLEEQRRAWFVEEARRSPETLYDRVTAATRRPPFDDYVWEVASDHKQRYHHWLDNFDLTMNPKPDHTVDYGGVGSVSGPTEPVGLGEMWWGETWFVLPARIGMHGHWNDNGLAMFGGLDWDSGDLHHSSYKVISRFYLDPARMPAANRVRSTPGGVLTGQMFAFTGGWAGPFGSVFDGDHWSKCRLRLHQRAFAVHPANPADAVPLAPFATSEINIVDVDGRFEHAVGNLPGGLPYPQVDIHLDKHRILRIDLELDLFITLEGDASIRFGGIGHSNPALYQASQWTLQPF